MFAAVSGDAVRGLVAPAYKPDPQFPPRVLSLWPVEEGYFGPARKREYEFGAVPLDDLRYLRTISEGELANASVYAENALANSSDTRAVQKAADNLNVVISTSLDASVNVVKRLLHEAGQGLAVSAQAFGQIAGEVQAWPEGVPLPIQQAIKAFALQWRDVDQDASERYFAAERIYSDFMLSVTNAAALQYRLWQLMGALYEEQIGTLKRRIEALQAAQADLRAFGDQFVQVLKSGVVAAEKVLNKVGGTLGLGSVGPILAIGAILLLGAAAASKGAFRK